MDLGAVSKLEKRSRDGYESYDFPLFILPDYFGFSGSDSRFSTIDSLLSLILSFTPTFLERFAFELLADGINLPAR